MGTRLPLLHLSLKTAEVATISTGCWGVSPSPSVIGGVTMINFHQNKANVLQHNQIACKKSTENHEQTSFHSDGPVDSRMDENPVFSLLADCRCHKKKRWRQKTC